MIDVKPRLEEKVYRALPLESSSTLKDFLLDRRAYVKKYLLGEREEKDNSAINIGKAVESILLDKEEDFEKKFVMSMCTKKPDGMMLTFCQELFRETLEATTEDGIVTKGFEEMAEAAHKLSGYKESLSTTLGKFTGKDPEFYYNELRETHGRDVTILSSMEREVSEQVAKKTLQNEDEVGRIIKMKSSKTQTVYNQLQVEAFEIDGLPLKMMGDKIVVSHKKKEIDIYDIKVTWDNHSFFKEYYLHRRAYIQGLTYHKGINFIKTTPEWRKVSGYKVNPPKFIVLDSTNFYDPLIFEMTDEDLIDAYNGFYHRNYWYEGVKGIIEELKWAKQNNIWTISKQNKNRKGILTIQECKNR